MQKILKKVQHEVSASGDGAAVIPIGMSETILLLAFYSWNR